MKTKIEKCCLMQDFVSAAIPPLSLCTCSSACLNLLSPPQPLEEKLAFTEHPLYARHEAKFYIHVISLNSLCPMSQGVGDSIDSGPRPWP